MKTLVLLFCFCALMGCDLWQSAQNEGKAWLAESKRQRELLKEEREELDNKERKIDRKSKDPDIKHDPDIKIGF